MLVRTAGVQPHTCSESIPARSAVKDEVNRITMRSSLFATGCVTGHISLFCAQWNDAPTRFDCLCEDDEIPTKRWHWYGLAGTRLISFYLAKPKPSGIEIRRDRRPTLSAAPHYPWAK